MKKHESGTPTDQYNHESARPLEKNENETKVSPSQKRYAVWKQNQAMSQKRR